MTAATAPVFEALIVPYRSVTGKGIAAMLAFVALFSVGVAGRLWLFRAPLAVAFLIFEFLMIAGLLWANLRHARASELIVLTPEALSVERRDWRGRKATVSLPATWLRIDLVEEKGTHRLLARSHGRAFEIGGFLHDADKVSLSKVLRTAIWDVRNPRFNSDEEAG